MILSRVGLSGGTGIGFGSADGGAAAGFLEPPLIEHSSNKSKSALSSLIVASQGKAAASCKSSMMPSCIDLPSTGAEISMSLARSRSQNE